MGIVKKLSIVHDFAVDPDTVVEVLGIGRASIYSVQASWKKIAGSQLNAVVKLMASNVNPKQAIYEDLGFQRTIDIADGSQSIQDAEFAYEHGFISIEHNGVTSGVLILDILAKTR